MNISKTLLSGMLAVGVASAASAAPTYVRLVGSTAYRAPVTQAIIDYLTSANSGIAPVSAYWGSSSTTLLKANGAIISGTVSGNQVVVETFWTGSAAGDVDLVTGQAIQDFLDYNTYSSQLVVGGTNLGTSPTYDASHPATTAAMSDSYYTSVAKVMSDANVSGTIGTSITTGAGLANALNNAAIVNAGSTTTGKAGKVKTVGIIPFEWVLGNPGSTTLTGSNMTQQAAKELIENGNINFSQISGNSSDVANFALLVGRNEDSGTRIDSAAEAQAGFGINPSQVLVSFNNNNTSTSQFPSPVYGIQTGGNGSSIASLTLWPESAPLNTQPNVSWSAGGHGGYVGGGDVANVLLAANPGASLSNNIDSSVAPTSGYFNPGVSQVALIGYLGISDAISALSNNSGGNAIALAYNGVPFSVANVQNGTYTVWGYEHMYYTTTTAPTGSLAKTVLDGIADVVFATDADLNSSGAHNTTTAAGIFYNSMNFTRPMVEGNPITPAE